VHAPPRPDDRHPDGGRLTAGPATPRRPILIALAVAALTALGVLAVARLAPPSGPNGPETIARGRPAPDVSGETLDGGSFRLADLRGRPVIVNFWGPSCIPCRDEFPLFRTKLDEHAADGLVIVGVLMDDPPEPARDFVAEMGATWETVLDPEGRLENAYLVPARPQSYFIDAEGILRAIQIGELTAEVFERQYATIAPAS
jgi:cytochrome c biogenesis protein CcmG/thiol:disulfide interchange protein DsbE